MGLGLKRTCLSCAAKFYDLEKDPILCPKCGKTFEPEDFNKPKRGRKKVVEEIEVEDIELEDDEEIELLEEDTDEIDDEDILPDGIEDDEAIEEMEEDSDRLLVEIEEENDDIIESDDGRD